MKKLLICVVALAMLVSMAACTPAPVTPTESGAPSEAVSEAPATPAPDTGKVLNIYVWNTEFRARFEEYFENAGYVPDGVTVNFIETPSKDGAYQKKLDEALLAQESAAADDKVDMFLIEADYALKYVNSDYTLDVYGDVGLTEADTADMYQYTKDICTDSNGVLKGVSWQGCPGALIYRRSIAKAVLGTDDPDQVQAQLDSWDKFDSVAEKAKGMGYLMTSGYVADYRVFSNNMTAPWVNANNEIVFDSSIKAYIEHAKKYLANGWTQPYDIWAPESFAEAKTNGKALCYFGPGWFFDFSLKPNALDNPLPTVEHPEYTGKEEVGNGSWGDWAICKGPQGFFWGGTWICAAAGSDNVNLVRDIMKQMTCNQNTLIAITNKFGDFTNNQKSMEKMANDPTYGNGFLGGQNHIKVLAQSAASISMKNSTMYDQLLNEPLPSSFLPYFLGNATEAAAYDDFYKKALTSYPELKRPAQ